MINFNSSYEVLSVRQNREGTGFMQYDTLTGLLSSKDFHDTCEKYIKEGSKKLVLIASDVSNFKYINEFYGRDTGDEFIKTMADYFYKENPRCLAACRKGSDQFRGLYDLGNFSHDRELERIVDMNTAFEDMMNKKYPNVYIHVYTGVYFISDSSEDTDTALDRVHIAKKQAKGKFDVKFQVYNQNDMTTMLNNMRMSNMFIHACRQGRLLMYLQPKFSISKNKIVGAEALVRILDDHSNIIPPAQIIPVLESTGVIDTLDNIMIENVFELQRRWINEGREVFTISVNVSRQRFTKGDFTDMAIALQKKYNIPPFLIEFEIVESVFIENTDTIVNTTNQLRSYGFLVSVDDFGSGYSSLNQIANMPADTIKLDHIFASKSLCTDKGRILIRTLINLLHQIDYNVVFEGIETLEQKQLVESYGCDLIQGFYYSRPIPVSDFENKSSFLPVSDSLSSIWQSTRIFIPNERSRYILHFIKKANPPSIILYDNAGIFFVYLNGFFKYFLVKSYDAYLFKRFITALIFPVLYSYSIFPSKKAAKYIVHATILS